MKKILERWANKLWYEDYYVAAWLSPLSFLYIDIVRFRRFLYRKGFLKSTKLTVPVVVVGNITVGGTGKTPLVIFLAQQLQQRGFKVGIVTRGYSGNNENWPLRVYKSTKAAHAGDEAVLIASQTDCPVAAAPLRVEAAQLLINKDACDIILTDDGLQHYALQRDIEIVVIDGQRRFGNNYFLPCGPLREPQERIQEADFVIINGGKTQDDEISMTLAADSAVNLVTHERKSLSEFKMQNCHALAAIGNPQRFFKMLATLGLKTENHTFPDHHRFRAKDINFDDNNAVLMTEKDAVKCHEFSNAKHWAVPVTPQLPDSFLEQLLVLIKEKHG
ncbi:MAG: tetraacyldisaccharide 4'-kinase [Methylococcaceae bacterium]|nr:tetraacyldisaccharide 4'-kinase [Methylococcaceae bacterium]